MYLCGRFPRARKPAGRFRSRPEGRFAIWSHTAKELYYVTGDGHIMPVPYTVIGGDFQPGKPQRWSDAVISVTTTASLDLAADGKRFAVFPPQETANGNLHLTFLLNFFDELKRRLPVR
jgi:hypothetical protein